MVFSFFKKQPQKMPERAAAKPKAPIAAKPASAPGATPGASPAITPDSPVKLDEHLPELEFTRSVPQGLSPNHPNQKTEEAPSLVDRAGQVPAVNFTDDEFALDFTISEFDRNYSDSSVMGINVDHDVDSMQTDIEQVAILYSNGQDAAARALLEAFVKIYRDADGLRIWQMLFDLLQLTDDHPAFDKLGILFAETCETSPPTWRHLVPESGPAALGVRSFTLQGVLTAENGKVLEPLKASLIDRRPVRIDCGKWVGCDDEIAGLLADDLLAARKKGVAVMLDQLESFIPRLRSRLSVGEQTHPKIWLLVLELLQRNGLQAQFEECAIDFAVTFERSPPSWEPIESVAGLRAAGNLPRDPRDAHYLSGEIKNARFDELPAILELMEAPVVDFSGVRRLDFFSAGQLANRLGPLKEAGCDIVIRNPNHLVAELMAVVGLNRVARIIVPKT